MRTGVIIVLLIVALAGCTDGEHTKGGEASPAVESGKPKLLTALGKVRATDSTRKYVKYGDVAAARALAQADPARFTSLEAVGVGPLGPFSPMISEDLGFNPLSFREGVQAGVGGASAGILWGDYDLSAVNNRFAAFGIQRSDSGDATTWTIDADNSGMGGPLDMIAGPRTLNVVRVRAGSFAYAITQDTLTWITSPGEDTLAKDPTIQALAACLGDVVTATMNRGFSLPETLAVGIRASSASDVTAVFCVAPGDKDTAEKIRAAVATKLTSGTSASGHPWSTLLTDPTVELTGDAHSVVRVLAKPAAGVLPAVVFSGVMADADLPELFGARLPGS